MSRLDFLCSLFLQIFVWVQANLILFLVVVIPSFAFLDILYLYSRNPKMMNNSPNDASQSKEFRDKSLAVLGFSVTVLSLILTQKRVSELSNFLPLLALSISFSLGSIQAMTWAERKIIFLKIQGRAWFWSVTSLFMVLVLLTLEFSELAGLILGISFVSYLAVRVYKLRKDYSIYSRYD